MNRVSGLENKIDNGELIENSGERGEELLGARGLVVMGGSMQGCLGVLEPCTAVPSGGPSSDVTAGRCQGLVHALTVACR